MIHRPSGRGGEDPVAPTPVVVRIERRAIAMADLSPSDLAALVAELDGRADETGCVILHDGRPFDRLVVVFASSLERFHMLSVTRHLRCPIIIVQDVTSWWYQGSNVLPDLDRFCRDILVREIGPAHAVFFGQSSGAYAALAASTYVPGSTVIACAPQTFADFGAKAAIRFVGIRPSTTPDDLVDLRPILIAKPDPTALRAVVIAGSEMSNPAHHHYWMDYLHALRLADVPGLDLFVVHSNAHALVHRNAPAFATLLDDLVGSVDLPVDERRGVLIEFLTQTFVPPGD